MFPEIEWLFGSIFSYYLLYNLVDFLYRGNEYYNQLADDRKKYFQKNIVKSYSLAGISIFGSYFVYQGFFNNNWDNTIIRRVGYMYSALDALGLIVVKNLPMNSKIHHSSTVLFSYLNTLVDYSQPTFWIGLPIYCMLSCYSFGVNYFLGMRLITPLKKMTRMIEFNIITYSLCLIINWAYQIYNVLRLERFTWDVWLFIGLVLFVVNDDIKLVTFLIHHWQKSKNGELPS